MDLSGRGARIAQKDITDLAAASEKLAGVAAAIKARRLPEVQLLVQTIIEVNEVILRIQTKGATAIARYLERKGVKLDSGYAAGDQVRQDTAAPSSAAEENKEG